MEGYLQCSGQCCVRKIEAGSKQPLSTARCEAQQELRGHFVAHNDPQCGRRHEELRLLSQRSSQFMRELGVANRVGGREVATELHNAAR